MQSIVPLLAQVPPAETPADPDWTGALSGKEFFVNLAEALRDLVARLVEWISPAFAARMEKTLFAQVTAMDLLAAAATTALVALVHLVIGSWLRRRAHLREKGAEAGWRPLILHAAARPLYLLLWVYGIFFALAPVLVRLSPPGESHPLQVVFDKIVDFGFFVALLWLFIELTRVVEYGAARWTQRTSSTIDDVLASLVIRSLRVILPVLAVILALPVMGLPLRYEGILSKIGSLLLVGAIAWVLCQAVLLLEKAILVNYNIKVADNLRARSIHTQVQVMRKTLLFLIAIFTVASALMLFEDVRRLGTSILASAGVMGIIIGFAAQRTISNLFAGLQIALTQPIRLDDVVIVENEWGRIEDISLTYVVVRIWDLRRLVVPIQYFIDKPFQNWTRVSADILGTVFLYCDYTVPVAELRSELERVVRTIPHWDGKVVGLQVTNATDRTVELRALASASDASKAWDLRCAIREQLLGYLQEHFPGSLPRARVEFDRGDIDEEAREGTRRPPARPPGAEL